MLVICNGAYKSGSTWLFNIVAQLADFKLPPKSYQNTKWRNPSIDPDKLVDFLSTMDFAQENYISKQHIVDFRQRDLLLSTPNLFVLDIARDVRDVVVSAYYHHRRDGRFVGSFEDFYQIEGRLIAHQVSRYHDVWRGRNDKVLIASYEALHADFVAELQRIAAFLGLPVSPALVERIRHETSIDRLRARYGEADQPADQRFFRKGMVGSWQDHLSLPFAEELRAIEAHGLTWPKQLQCKARTKLHRALRAYPRRIFGRATRLLQARQ
jgi:Sulfotransferase domain